jgi:hypothetical protein
LSQERSGSKQKKGRADGTQGKSHFSFRLPPEALCEHGPRQAVLVKFELYRCALRGADAAGGTEVMSNDIPSGILKATFFLNA